MVARATQYGVAELALTLMSAKANFRGPIGRRFLVEHAAWLSVAHCNDFMPADLDSEIDRCIFEQWLRVVTCKVHRELADRPILEPPFIDWTASGLYVAKRIFGDQSVAS